VCVLPTCQASQLQTACDHDFRSHASKNPSKIWSGSPGRLPPRARACWDRGAARPRPFPRIHACDICCAPLVSVFSRIQSTCLITHYCTYLKVNSPAGRCQKIRLLPNIRPTLPDLKFPIRALQKAVILLWKATCLNTRAAFLFTGAASSHMLSPHCNGVAPFFFYATIPCFLIQCFAT